ncbi:MAG TPA: EboA domain-containing protein [Fibrobacteria bacterium]|nr:EboA domain-containing protein [Fibrobacteria bacterium]
MSAQTLLLNWLKPRLAPESLAWLEEKAALLATGAPEKTVSLAFSMALRYSGKAPLALDAAALKAARTEVPGWNPSDWTCDDAARVFLLLSLPPGTASSGIMDRLYQTADVAEAAALQKAVAVLAFPEGHLARAREALRSNIKAVFEAITLRNPYPALNFDNVGWNQMVVKTFFVESPVHEIEGLDRRVNPPLSRMLSDLAEERWAAGRAFSPQLWRCVGPCADSRGLDNLKKALAQGAPAEKRAAVLALQSCPDPQAALILQAEPALAAAAREGTLTWENL